MSELKANKERVLTCYNRVDASTKEVLKHIFGREVFEFDYKTITSFEKACERHGASAVAPSINKGYFGADALKSSIALYKLLIIQEVINDGWKQGENEVAWYPYWVFYSQKELDDMGEKKQKELDIKLLSDVRAGDAETVGVRGAFAKYRGASTNTFFGFPLCLKDAETAVWMGNQFEDLFFDCFGITVKKSTLNISY